MRIEDTKKCGQFSKPDKQTSVTAFPGYQVLKEHLMLRIVGAEKYKEELSVVPHRQLLDMLLYVCIPIPDPRNFIGLIVTDEVLTCWGISEDTLFDDALEVMHRYNTPGMQDILEAAEEKTKGRHQGRLFVATTTCGIFGAAVIADREFLKDCRETMQEDFYILPSSVHEVLFYPVSEGMPVSQLKDTVVSINRTEVEPKDRLTDSVYMYKGETEQIILVA